jgi:hypothetical protein
LGAPPGVYLPFDERSTDLTPKAQGKRGRDAGGTPFRPEFIRQRPSAPDA